MDAAQIRIQVAKWLADEIVLDDFEDWIASNTWNVHQQSDGETQQLAFAIELALSEHSGGNLTLKDLKSRLRRLLEFIQVGSARNIDTAGTLGGPSPMQGLRRLRLLFADKPHVTASSSQVDL